VFDPRDELNGVGVGFGFSGAVEFFAEP